MSRMNTKVEHHYTVQGINIINLYKFLSFFSFSSLPPSLPSSPPPFSLLFVCLFFFIFETISSPDWMGAHYK